MKLRNNLAMFAAVVALSTLSGCVTEPAGASLARARATQPAIVAVARPGLNIPAGSTFTWLPEAISFYRDERLQGSTIQYAIEREIEQNLHALGYSLTDSASAPNYNIAYTAALESSLDDDAIMRRFGLLPGMGHVSADASIYEKGSLIIYVLDRTGKDVLWRSAVQAAVDLSAATQAREQRLKAIVKSMFQSFPKSGG